MHARVCRSFVHHSLSLSLSLSLTHRNTRAHSLPFDLWPRWARVCYASLNQLSRTHLNSLPGSGRLCSMANLLTGQRTHLHPLQTWSLLSGNPGLTLCVRGWYRSVASQFRWISEHKSGTVVDHSRQSRCAATNLGHKVANTVPWWWLPFNYSSGDGTWPACLLPLSGVHHWLMHGGCTKKWSLISIMMMRGSRVAE